jgi:hypothetical protein
MVKVTPKLTHQQVEICFEDILTWTWTPLQENQHKPKIMKTIKNLMQLNCSDACTTTEHSYVFKNLVVRDS